MERLRLNFIVGLAAIALTAVAIGIGMTIDAVNLSLNAIAVQGQLTAASETCTLYRHYKWSQDRESDPISCDLARRALWQSPEWNNSQIHYDTSLSWTYRAPDGLWRQGATHVPLARAGLPATGDAVRIYVLKSDFGRSRFGGAWRGGA